jgi:RNA-directed DNA polymerase
VKGQYRLRVAPKSLKRLKLKLKGLTRKTCPIAFADRIASVNRLMKGWLHYFKSMLIAIRSSKSWMAGYATACATASGSTGRNPKSDEGASFVWA